MTTPIFETLDLEQLEHVAGGNIFSSIAHAISSLFGSSAAHQVAQTASQQGPTPPELNQAVSQVDRALNQTDTPYTDPTDFQIDALGQDGVLVNQHDSSGTDIDWSKADLETGWS
jgi:hypothetical protein